MKRRAKRHSRFARLIPHSSQREAAGEGQLRCLDTAAVIANMEI